MSPRISMEMMDRRGQSILCAIAALLLTASLTAGTFTWNGSASSLWSNPANWTPNGVPGNLDILAFPLSAPSYSIVNDLPAGTSFYQLYFSGGAYSIGGNSLGILSSIDGSGTVTFTAPITIDGNNVTTSVSRLEFDGPVNLRSNRLGIGTNVTILGAVSGTGGFDVTASLRLAGDNSYSGTTTVSNYAYLQVDGNQPNSAIYGFGNRVRGVGSLGPVFLTSSDLRPRDGAPGRMSMASMTLVSCSLSFQIGGITAGSTYDQMVVNGPVTLDSGGFTITIINGFVPVPGQTFVIIDHSGTDPVSGRFSSPEGTIITPQGTVYPLRISYHGGDGNDVTLAAVRNGVATTTTVTTATPIVQAGASPLFNVTVTSALGLPTGNVSFLVDGSTVGTATLNNGTASFATTLNLGGSHAVSALYDGDSQFAASTSAIFNETVQAPAPHWIDLNGDGKADVVWRNASSRSNSVWYMEGTGIATSDAVPTGPALDPYQPSWHATGFGDFDRTGKSDIVWLGPDHSTGTLVQLWLMNGSSVLARPDLAYTPDQYTRAIVADIDGDGTSDIIFWSPGAVTHVWLMSGGTIGSQITLPANSSTMDLIGAADFNHDGKADLFWRDRVSGANAIVFVNGKTVTQSATVSVLNPAWQIAAIADFDGDGNADILWRNVSSGDDSIWIMNGASILSSAALPSVPDTNWTIATWGDYDGDSKNDLFWRNTATGSNAMWLMNGTALPLGVALPPVYDTNWMPLKP